MGEKLTGFLKSGDGRSVVWPGVDGSLRLGKTETPDAENEFGVGFGFIRPTSLIVSDSEKEREELLQRNKLREGQGAGGDGGGNMKKEAKAGGSW